MASIEIMCKAYVGYLLNFWLHFVFIIYANEWMFTSCAIQLTGSEQDIDTIFVDFPREASESVGYIDYINCIASLFFFFSFFSHIFFYSFLQLLLCRTWLDQRRLAVNGKKSIIYCFPSVKKSSDSLQNNQLWIGRCPSYASRVDQTHPICNHISCGKLIYEQKLNN